ncbi:signal peptidase I [Paenibacillus senegalensis]|uniref:signal peptidase I n=1 Tax=Paenibacillus senegalensis TaxID=1465766 RepID=UPI0002892967|nr:signal peptidase I [Paenibacillus senegalensis]
MSSIDPDKGQLPFNQQDELNQGSQNKWLAEVWDWIKSISVALVIVVLINQFLFSQSIVEGQSMEPTLENGERLFINRLLYQFKEPHYGDIIVFKDPQPIHGKRDYLVKRVVAEAGDEVVIREGKLYVNGEFIEETYVDTEIEDGNFGPYIVEEGHVFVMGDNRKRRASRDSRSFGAIQYDLVIGRADWIIWPPVKIKSI